MAFDFNTFGAAPSTQKPGSSGFDFNSFGGNAASGAVNSMKDQLENPAAVHPLDKALTPQQHVDKLAELQANPAKSLPFGEALHQALLSPDTWKKVGKAALNTPGSAFNFAKGVVTTPFEQAKQGQSIPSDAKALVKEAGGVGKATQAFAKELPGAAYHTLVPESIRALISGDTQKAEDVLIKDPFGQAAVPVFAALGAGEAFGKVTGGVNPVAAASEELGGAVTKPIAGAAGKVGEAAKTGARYGVSQASGLSPSTIDMAVKGAGKVSKAMREGMTRDSVGKELGQALDTHIENMSESGKQYENIRGNAAKTISTPANLFHKVLNDNGITMKNGKVVLSAESPHLTPSDTAALEGVWKQYAKTKTFTPNGYLNFREALTGLSDFDATKSGKLEGIAKQLRSEYNDFAHNQHGELKSADEVYAPLAKEFKQMKKDWLQKDVNGEWVMKDNALNKMANAVGEGKGKVLARLEETVPGITEKLHILKSLEDLERATGQKTGTYTRAVLGGGVGFAKGGPLGAVIGAAMTHPAIAMRLLETAGRAQGLTGAAMESLRALGPQFQEMLHKDINPGLGIEDVTKGGTVMPEPPPGEAVPKAQAAPEGGTTNPEGFQGLQDLSTKIIEKLKGKTTVSKQFISDLTNSGDVKQTERDLIRKALGTEGDKVNVKDFAEKVQEGLLPVKSKNATEGRYEGINLPEQLRGDVSSYHEKVYQSPVETSAGNVHFSGSRLTKSLLSEEEAASLKKAKQDLGIANKLRTKAYTQGKQELAQIYSDQMTKANKTIRNLESKMTESTSPQKYFAHSRIEDMADGSTRRVIELQSDLFQKGGLENQQGYKGTEHPYYKQGDYSPEVKQHTETRAQDLARLEPYRNTWHERVIKEEVRQAAKDGKKTVLFPTGETAMKVEGLVNRTDKWVTLENEPVTGKNISDGDIITYQTHEGTPHEDRRFLITKNNGDGTFKAVDSMTAENDHGFYQLLEKKGALDDGRVPSLEELQNTGNLDEESMKYLDKLSEQLSAKDVVDQGNPIYKFYEKEVGKYLKNKYQASPFTDDKGVSWWKVDVAKDAAQKPVEAFAAVPAAGALKALGGKKEKKK